MIGVQGKQTVTKNPSDESSHTEGCGGGGTVEQGGRAGSSNFRFRYV